MRKPSPDNQRDDSEIKLGDALSPKADADTADAGDRQQQTQGKSNGSQYVVRAFKASIEWIDRRSTLVMALATAVIAILTGFYVHYARAQWQIMTKALGVNERAWVFGRLVEAPYVRTPEGLFAVRIALHNSGKSPAFSAIHGIECSLKPEPPGEVVSEPTESFIPNNVTEKEAVPAKHTCWRLSRETLAQMIKDNKPVYLWLLIRYKDPFTDEGQFRFTQQCWIQHPPMPGGKVEPCGPGMHKFL